jgi:hypothetical protein
MKSLMASHVHTTVQTPSRLVLSSLYAQMPRTHFLSSRAHATSHFCPLDVGKFLLTNAITPSERRAFQEVPLPLVFNRKRDKDHLLVGHLLRDEYLGVKDQLEERRAAPRRAAATAAPKSKPITMPTTM